MGSEMCIRDSLYCSGIINHLLTVSQAYTVAVFLWQYLIPVSVFAFCYGRIFHTIRYQSKTVISHTGRGQNIAMATTSRDQNAGQAQQQATGTTTGNKMSRTELNILKTMITVIVLFLIFWCVPAFTNLLQPLGVSNVHINNALFLLCDYAKHIRTVLLSRFCLSVCLSVCPSICQTRVL